MTTTLQGRRVAITGAARGIGFSTAVELHRRGASVVIGDLDETTARTAASKIGSDVEGFALDVSDHDSFAAFVASATINGPLDVLVNNAGIMPIGRFLDLSADTHRRAVQVNLLGCINGMHLALPGMLERGSGHIVNVSSTAGRTPVPGGMSYCATKSAVVALTETARVEYAGTGLRFTCVMPHFTNTELIAGTKAMKLFPVVEPEDVACAIGDAITTPRADVFVPKLIGPVLNTQPLMGRTVRDIVSRKLGAYNTFLNIDREARSGYDDRISKP